MQDKYEPPYSITNEIINSVAEIGEMVGSIEAWDNMSANPQLRRDNRVRTIHASLAIENNSLSLDQVTDIINGKHVLGIPQDILEVKNAYRAYEQLLAFDPYAIKDLLKAHELLMTGLVAQAGVFREGGVGVFAGNKLIHMAPPAHLVSGQIQDLLKWVKEDNQHPLIKSCVFHYEFEFIHPFADGNGRMGRMWQTLILSRWRSIFAWLPVETLIRQRQDEYYAVLGKSDSIANATPFIEFLLRAIKDMLTAIYTNSEQVTAQDIAQVGDQVSAQVSTQVGSQIKRVLEAIGNETLTSNQIMKRLGLSHRGTFRKNYLQPALDLGLIEMTVPDKPNSSKQRYRRGV